jgi:Protein of unknown function DUF45
LRRESSAQYRAHKEAARALIATRVAYFATTYGISYKRIAIRDTRRSWGSCSDKGNLNFSYKLLFLPPCLRDYIIVHELCHRLVLNHSAAFWYEVVTRMPDAQERAQALRYYERTQGTARKKLQVLADAHAGGCAYCRSDSLQTNRPTVFVPPQSKGSKGTVR